MKLLGNLLHSHFWICSSSRLPWKGLRLNPDLPSKEEKVLLTGQPSDDTGSVVLTLCDSFGSRKKKGHSIEFMCVYMHTRVFWGGWATLCKSAASLDLLKFRFHYYQDICIFFSAQPHLMHINSALTLHWGQPPPSQGIYNTLNGILKIPICLVVPINKCEPFHPASVGETCHRLVLRQAWDGVSEGYWSKRPAVTGLSQGRDYVLNHITSFLWASFKFLLSLSLQPNGAVCEIRAAFPTLSLAGGLCFERVFVKIAKPTHWGLWHHDWRLPTFTWHETWVYLTRNLRKEVRSHTSSLDQGNSHSLDTTV